MALEHRESRQLPPSPEVGGEIKRFSPEALQALEGAGYWICEIRPVSIAQLLFEENKRFGFVNSSKSLRAIVPEATEAAVNPRQLVIPESNWEPLSKQVELIKAFSLQLQDKIPGVVARIEHVSTYVQLDLLHQKEEGGKLLVGFYARSLDETFGLRVARVGRLSAFSRLFVDGWLRDRGDENIWAVPVVVPK